MRRRKRLPDLGKLERDARFRDLDAAATAWIDASLRLVEEGACWLTPAGRTILDYCITVTSPQGVMHRGTFSVTGQRSVTSAYGFDGSQGSQLDHLSAVLAGAGWREPAVPRIAQPPDPAGLSLADKKPPAQGEWHLPDSAVGLVPPDGRADVRIGWAGHGDSVEPVVSLMTAGTHLEKRTDFYRPVQIQRSNAAELIATTLAGHQNVIAIQMAAVYYRDPDRARQVAL